MDVYPMFVIIGGEASMGVGDTFKHASEIQKQEKWSLGFYATIVEVGNSYVHLGGAGKRSISITMISKRSKREEMVLKSKP